MKTRQIVAMCCALAATAAIAQTSVYRWVDKDGKVHFSDAPPPADARDSTQKTMGGGYVAEELPYATQQAARRNPVVFYTAPSCGEPCDGGRELLSSRGIPFSERNVEADAAAQEALRGLIGGLYVPTLTIGATTLKGFEPDGWNSALGTAGYPGSRAPGQSPTRGTQDAPRPTSASPATPSQ